jgi:hypothetical protein
VVRFDGRRKRMEPSEDGVFWRIREGREWALTLDLHYF